MVSVVWIVALITQHASVNPYYSEYFYWIKNRMLCFSCPHCLGMCWIIDELVGWQRPTSPQFIPHGFREMQARALLMGAEASFYSFVFLFSWIIIVKTWKGEQELNVLWRIQSSVFFTSFPFISLPNIFLKFHMLTEWNKAGCSYSILDVMLI